MRLFVSAFVAALAITLNGPVPQILAAEKAAYISPLVTSRTAGHAIDVEVDIRGAKELHLVVTDGGNGYGCDWADWAEPRLVGPDKTLRLTDLKWAKAETQWGKVRKNANANGGPLLINGTRVPYGIGTHANSVISFPLPPKHTFTKFRVRAGVDNGGTDQGNGQNTSVKFLVYTKTPPKRVLNLVRSGAADVGSREASDAVAGLTLADGVEATLFASEPEITSVTNLDVDHRGRVWVCEVVNYRRNNGRRPEGDRILILEDTDGDGRSDSTKVYYQGRDVDSAMGICVLGNKVIVSCSPNVFVFTDEDGDDRPDRKDVLFSKTGDPQHDHSAHTFLFGPDGKLYWNFGNTGKRVHDRNGEIITDVRGNPVVDNGKPYFGGMAFRCNPDGSEFEVLAHNFRNNYELTVDSFGTVWQSDNDDDGNRGVRINYVMEHGNFGYRDQLTGAGWRSPRTGMHTDIPLKHWHLNDPGVVPNLLQTGAGSPTGITIYEGRLLPKPFWNQVIHCDAGPNIVRAYPVKTDGAGYSATVLNLAHGENDNWFRPADVCVAPDGSVFVTDWYDPGVGGHNQRDLDRGRIFRLAPPNHKYRVPAHDFKTVDGALAALQSPSFSVRYLAWTALHARGESVVAKLRSFIAGNDDPRQRARVLWLLGKIDGHGADAVKLALADRQDDIRIVGLRLARQLKMKLPPILDTLASDKSAAVRRECAIALRDIDDESVPALWTKLASAYDGEDRWYLEALGIGADGRWDRVLKHWVESADWSSPAARHIIWRSRSEATPTLLARLLADPELPDQATLRLLRAFDFQSGPAKNRALAALAFSQNGDLDERQSLVLREALNRLGSFDLDKNPQHRIAVNSLLDRVKGQPTFVQLVDRLDVRTRFSELWESALGAKSDQYSVDATRVLLSKGATSEIRRALAGEDDVALRAAQILRMVADERAVPLLLPIVDDGQKQLELRREATRALAKSRRGGMELVRRAKADRLDQPLRFAAAFDLHASPVKEIKAAAQTLFPLPAGKDAKPLPPVPELLKLRGDVGRGLVVFQKAGTCANCHVVGKEGKEVGPNLTEIGSKLSREALFESVLFPSAGISHNYETHVLALANGEVVTGLVVSQTPESMTIRNAEALVRTIAKSDIEDVSKQNVSLMPADLQKLMTAQELADVVAYLTTLKKKSP